MDSYSSDEDVTNDEILNIKEYSERLDSEKKYGFLPFYYEKFDSAIEQHILKLLKKRNDLTEINEVQSIKIKERIRQRDIIYMAMRSEFELIKDEYQRLEYHIFEIFFY